MRAPWLDPELLPPAESGGWSWWWGSPHPMPLESLEAEIRRDPTRPQPKAKGFVMAHPARPQVTLVEAPGLPRVVPAAEVPELREALLERSRAIAKAKLLKNTPIAIVAGLAAAALLWFDVDGLGLIALVYAIVAAGQWIDSARALRLLKRDPARQLAQEAREVRFGIWLHAAHHPRPWRTYGLGATWALLFILQLGLGMDRSEQMAALVKDHLAAQPWRLLTGPMLHGSPMHLLMNGGAMLSLGLLLERTAHRKLLVPLWLAGALSGSLASWALLPHENSVGASGGLMALFGFLAVMGWRRRELLPPDFGASLLRGLLFMGVLGALAWTIIDNGAHGGGLAAGALAGWVSFRDPEGPLPLEDRRGLDFADALGLTLFCLLAVFTAWKLFGG